MRLSRVTRNFVPTRSAIEPATLYWRIIIVRTSRRLYGEGGEESAREITPISREHKIENSARHLRIAPSDDIIVFQRCITLFCINQAADCITQRRGKRNYFVPVSFDKKKKKKERNHKTRKRRTVGRTGWEIVARSYLQFKLVKYYFNCLLNLLTEIYWILLG